MSICPDPVEGTLMDSESHGIREFYYGASYRWPLDYIPRAMISFSCVRRMKKPWKITIPWMMDSGAFFQILKHGDYQWGPEVYASGISIWNPPVAWTMDYPCEPSIRAAGGYTPTEAQAKTNENTRRLLDLGAKVSSVVQGWTLDDYLQNLDTLRSDGLMTERLGIGSICRRGRSEEIVRVIRAIHQNVPGSVKLHGFGVKSDVLKREAKFFLYFFLYSADSASWAVAAFKRYTGGHPGPISAKAPILQRYVSKHEALLFPTDPLGMFA